MLIACVMSALTAQECLLYCSHTHTVLCILQ